ncbi:hypothetical protein V2G26_009029 [Clonostachys chloroleuca]
MLSSQWTLPPKATRIVLQPNYRMTPRNVSLPSLPFAHHLFQSPRLRGEDNMLAQSQARQLSICTSHEVSASGECMWTWDRNRDEPPTDPRATTSRHSAALVLPASHTLYSPTVRGDQSIPQPRGGRKVHALTKKQAPSERGITSWGLS